MHGVGKAVFLPALFALQLLFDSELGILMRNMLIYLNIVVNSGVWMADAMGRISPGLCCEVLLSVGSFLHYYK